MIKFHRLSVIPDFTGYEEKKYTKTNKRRGIMLHRLGPSVHGKNLEIGLDVIRAFTRREKWRQRGRLQDPAGAWTGYKIPYNFVLSFYKDSLYQLLPLSVVGPHARGASDDYVSLAVLANFDRKKPTAEQTVMTAEAIAYIALQLGDSSPITLCGHTEIPGATSDTKKNCPGRYADLDLLCDLSNLYATEYNAKTISNRLVRYGHEGDDSTSRTNS